MEEWTLVSVELVPAKALPGWLDKSPPVAVLLLVVTESPASVMLRVTLLRDTAGTRPPVVVVRRPGLAGDKLLVLVSTIPPVVLQPVWQVTNRQLLSWTSPQKRERGSTKNRDPQLSREV